MPKNLRKEVIFKHVEVCVNKFSFRLEGEALSALKVFMAEFSWTERGYKRIHLGVMKNGIFKFFWQIGWVGRESFFSFYF